MEHCAVLERPERLPVEGGEPVLDAAEGVPGQRHERARLPEHGLALLGAAAVAVDGRGLAANVAGRSHGEGVTME